MDGQHVVYQAVQGTQQPTPDATPTTAAGPGSSHWPTSTSSHPQSATSVHDYPSSMYPPGPGDLQYASVQHGNMGLGDGTIHVMYSPSHVPPHQPTIAPAQMSSLGMPQVESSVGPSRVLTRRQRAAQQRSVSAPGLQHHLAPDSQGTYYTGSMSPPPTSRPGTPNSSHAMRAVPLSAPPHLSGHTTPGSLITPLSHSPPHPSTPLSSSSQYSRYGFPHHSRSVSGATSGPRSASPALSIRSTMTSLSSASGLYGDRMSAEYSAVHDKQKKTRLTNAQRREICEFHQKHPTSRQEDIAMMWRVERSTISKILKAKAKWLASPFEEDHKTARHRPSKFPEVEKDMELWLQEHHKDGIATITLSDQLIRNKAREIASGMGIGEDKFKASSGWIENFKHRHNIKRGVWVGVDDWIAGRPSSTANEPIRKRKPSPMIETAEDEAGPSKSTPDGEGSSMYPPLLDTAPKPPIFPPTDNGMFPPLPEESRPPSMYPPMDGVEWDGRGNSHDQQQQQQQQHGSEAATDTHTDASCGPAPVHVHPPHFAQSQSMPAPPVPHRHVSSSLANEYQVPRTRAMTQRHVSAPVMFGMVPEPSELPSLSLNDIHNNQQPQHHHMTTDASGHMPSPTDSVPTSNTGFAPNPYAYLPASHTQVPTPAQSQVQTPTQSHVEVHLHAQAQAQAHAQAMAHAHAQAQSQIHSPVEPSAPGMLEAQEHMAAMLSLLDAQPGGAGSILSAQDRASLAHIRSKLQGAGANATGSMNVSNGALYAHSEHPVC